MGGAGLYLPFNSIVWMAVATVIFLATWLMCQQQIIRLPAFWRLILAGPLLILFSGFVVGMEQPLSWMLRIAAIFLGFLLFLGLFQFNASRRTVQNALYILCGIFTLHAVIGVIQLLPGSLFSNLIPNVGNQIAIGMFQQPNLQASLLATAIALTIYLVSCSDFKKRPLWLQLLPLSCLLLSTFVLMSSGSRVGLMGGTIALVLMLVFRFALLNRRRSWSLAMLLVFFVGGSAGLVMNDGAFRAYSKMEQLAEEGKDIRKDVYRISWIVIKEKPLLGHGIGSFQRVFHNKAAEYQLATDDFNLSVRFTHPHNELLLWGVEAGLMGLVACLLGVVAVFRQIMRLGWQRGGSMAALLFPIALHTQVEHPFYISAYHWIVFVFLLFIVFQFRCKTYPLRTSLAAEWCMKTLSILLLAAVFWFCSISLLYSYKIAHVLFSGEAKLSVLNTIRQHPYFTDVATRSLLGNLSKNERVSQEKAITLEYVEWMKVYLKREPDVGVFADLIRAYAYLGDTVSMQATIDRALYLYRDHPLILRTVEEITENRLVN